MKVNHRGLTAVQSENNLHVMVFAEDGRAVMHCTCDNKMNENELRSVIDNYFNIISNEGGFFR